MRQLFNAFAQWMSWGLDDGDAWAALGRFAVVAAIVLAAFAGIIAAIVGIALLTTSKPEHGSCKVGHYTYSVATKTHIFVCDEYYPLPQVEGQ